MKTILFLLFFPLGIFAQVNLGQSLIGHWAFNGNANDSSPYGHNGTVSGATLVPGKLGIPNTAYFFDGINDFIEVASSGLLNSFPGDSMTIYVYLKVSGFYMGICHGNCVVDKGNSDFIAGHYSIRFSDFFSSTFLNCSSPVNSSQQNYTAHISNSGTTATGYLPFIDTTLWDCLIVTSDGVTCKTYLNGIQVGSFSLVGPLGSNNDNLFFGRKNSQAYPYWMKGIIDEIRIYNRVINTQEMDSLCNQFLANNVVANFLYTKIDSCNTVQIQFTDSSYGMNTSVQTWLWDFGDGTTSNQQNPLHTYASSGNFSVSLIVSNGLGLSDTFSQMLSITPPPQINLTILSSPTPPILCQGEVCTLQASGASSYQWSGSITNGVPFVPSMSAWYTVVGTDSNGCIGMDSVFVEVNPVPVININSSSPAICVGQTLTLTATGGANYFWSHGITNGISFTPISTNTYTVTATNTFGCTNESSVLVPVNPLPVVQAMANPNPVCLGEPLTLSASGAIQYVWSGMVQNGVPFTPNATDTYTVLGTDVNGCQSWDSITVPVLPLPQLSVNPHDTTICFGDSVLISTQGAYTYTWNPSTNLIPVSNNSMLVFPANTTNYIVTGSDAQGCSATILSQIQVKPAVDIQITKNRDANCTNRNVELQAGGAQTYQWQPENSPNNGINQIVNYTVNETTLFTVTGWQDGCSGVDSLWVKYNSTVESALQIPNAFTPNGDGLNDCFRILYAGEVLKFYLAIYNRWGQRVFETDDYQNCWNGDFNNMRVELGTYYFHLKLGTSCGTVRVNGDITIIY